MNWKIEQENGVLVQEKQKEKKTVFSDEMQRLHFRRRQD